MKKESRSYVYEHLLDLAPFGIKENESWVGKDQSF